MHLTTWRINAQHYRRTKSRLLGFYFFAPCPCGCTTDYGVGLTLYFFGVALHWGQQ